LLLFTTYAIKELSIQRFIFETGCKDMFLFFSNKIILAIFSSQFINN